MGFIYKESDKQSLKDRNDLFKEVGVLNLEKKGFERAPFKTSQNGEFDKSIKGYCYQLGRIRESKFLETIYVYILKGEPWIQIYLNVFELTPTISSVSLLKDTEGLSFGSPPIA